MKSYFLEPVVLILRGGSSTKKIGDDFEFSATILIDEGVAHIKGATGNLPINPSLVKSLYKELKTKYGVSKIRWKRNLLNGTVKKVAHGDEEC